MPTGGGGIQTIPLGCPTPREGSGSAWHHSAPPGNFAEEPRAKRSNSESSLFGPPVGFAARPRAKIHTAPASKGLRLREIEPRRAVLAEGGCTVTEAGESSPLELYIIELTDNFVYFFIFRFYTEHQLDWLSGGKVPPRPFLEPSSFFGKANHQCSNSSRGIFLPPPGHGSALPAPARATPSCSP